MDSIETKAEATDSRSVPSGTTASGTNAAATGTNAVATGTNAGAVPSHYEVTDPDVRLMLMVRDGNAAAFEEVVRRYQDRVLGLLQNLVPNRELAEDLAQDVFVRVYRARENYTPQAKFATWLFTITHNVAKNAIRQLSRRKEVQVSDPSPTAGDDRPGLSLDQMAKAESGLLPARVLDRMEISEIVRQAMDLLPPRQRMVLLLAKFEEMSYQDIGETMGLTVQAVKSLLSRARNNLREYLQPYLDSGRLPSAQASAPPQDEQSPT